MRFYRSRCFVVPFVLVLAGTAMAVDYVDIGVPTSESGHNLVSWGPIEPLTSLGTYGGIDHCRAIWSSLDTPNPGSRDAYIDMNFAGGSELVSFMHLEGLADDTFEVWIEGAVRFTFTDPGNTGERWYTSGFYYTPTTAGVHTVRFEATGTQWTSWSTYGQVCIAEVRLGPGGPVLSEKSSWGEVKALYR